MSTGAAGQDVQGRPRGSRNEAETQGPGSRGVTEQQRVKGRPRQVMLSFFAECRMSGTVLGIHLPIIKGEAGPSESTS